MQECNNLGPDPYSLTNDLLLAHATAADAKIAALEKFETLAYMLDATLGARLHAPAAPYEQMCEVIAERVMDLQQEVTRLREALERIASHDPSVVGRKWAHDALAATPATKPAEPNRSPGLLAAAEHIESTWGQAYPEDVPFFKRLPRGEGGVSDEARSRISAGMARHMVKALCQQLRWMAKGRDLDAMPAAEAPAEPLQHGVNCPKVEHDQSRAMYYNHDSTYDGPVSGWCGRCHVALPVEGSDAG